MIEVVAAAAAAAHLDYQLHDDDGGDGDDDGLDVHGDGGDDDCVVKIVVLVDFVFVMRMHAEKLSPLPALLLVKANIGHSVESAYLIRAS